MELQVIQNKIYEIRGQRVMLDFDLAEMYEVKTKVLKQAVRRNIQRFPFDFMFELSKDEFHQLVTNCDQFPETLKHSYVSPMVFTEQGVSMLSTVLRSQTAIEVNISIMRAFVAFRKVLNAAKESDLLPTLMDRIKALEEVSEETLAAINDLSEDTRKEFDDIYIALAELAAKHKQVSKPRIPIGYIKPKDNG